MEEVTLEWEGALGGADGRAVKPETAGAKALGQEWACVSEALSQAASRGPRAGRAPQGVATHSKTSPFDSASFPVTRTSPDPGVHALLPFLLFLLPQHHLQKREKEGKSIQPGHSTPCPLIQPAVS